MPSLLKAQNGSLPLSSNPEELYQIDHGTRHEAIVFSEDLIAHGGLLDAEWIYLRWSASALPRRVELMTRIQAGGWKGLSIFGGISGAGHGLFNAHRDWRDEKLIIQDGGIRTRIYHAETRRLDQFCWKESLGNGRDLIQEYWQAIDKLKASLPRHLISLRTNDLESMGILVTEIIKDSLGGSWGLSGICGSQRMIAAAESWQIMILEGWALLDGVSPSISPWILIPCQKLQEAQGASISDPA